MLAAMTIEYDPGGLSILLFAIGVAAVPVVYSLRGLSQSHQ